MAILKDNYGRSIDYVRISLTEECNMLCQYCRSREDNLFVDKSGYLTLEEWKAYAKTLYYIGVKKIKLTGGEPLLYPYFLEFLKYLKQELQFQSVTLTTNALLLDSFLNELDPSLIDSINISLDAFDEDIFKTVTGRSGSQKIKNSILACMNKGISTKVNTVILAGINDGEIFKMVEFAKENPLAVRFIEMMPLGRGRDYQLRTSQELLKEIEAKFGKMEGYHKKLGNGPAIYYRRDDFKGVIGFIEPMSHQFCGECNRIRINANGDIQLCLAYGKSFSPKEWLKLPLEERAEKFRELIMLKPLGHHFHEVSKNQKDDLEMWRIGG